MNVTRMCWLAGWHCEHKHNKEMTVVLFEFMSIHDAFSYKAIELFILDVFRGHYPNK
jgi:hypothetical protein